MKKTNHRTQNVSRSGSSHALYDLLPHDSLSLATLRERSNVLAKSAIVKDLVKAKLGSVLVSLTSNDKYIIPYSHVAEVCEITNIYPIPKCPEWIAGVANWRGKLLTIVDLEMLLRKSHGVKGELKNVVIVNDHEITMGFMVANVLGSREYDDAELQQVLPVKSAVKQDYINGLVGGTDALLNIKAIFDAIQSDITQWRK